MTRPDGSKINIRKTTEVLQLYMNAEGCRPSKQHVMLRTPHAVSKPGSLLCTICQCAGEQYSGQGQAPSKAELGFISMLTSLELDQQTAWQVATWWWKERKAQIDAYIYTAKLYLQVDGSKHTSCFRGKKAASSIATDVDCCVAACASCRHRRQRKLAGSSSECKAAAVHSTQPKLLHCELEGA